MQVWNKRSKFIHNRFQSKIFKKNILIVFTPHWIFHFFICADRVFQAQKRPYLSNVLGEDKCSMAKRRGQNNIMKFMSNTKAQPWHKVALSSTHHLTCLQKFQIPAIPAKSGQIRRQPVRGRRYLRVSFPSAIFQVREVSPHLFFFSFF